MEKKSFNSKLIFEIKKILKIFLFEKIKQKSRSIF